MKNLKNKIIIRKDFTNQDPFGPFWTILNQFGQV